MFQCRCPFCRVEYTFQAASAGDTIACGNCGNAFRIARPSLCPCPDCGREISRHAECCPHCGRPRPAEMPVKPEASFLGSVVRSKFQDVVKWWSRL